MGNTWALEADTRWHYIRDWAAPEDRVRLAKEIKRVRDPREFVGILYLTLVRAYADGCDGVAA